MPPTLGRLVPCAENVVSNESSPMHLKPGVGGRMRTPSSADFQHLPSRADVGLHSNHLPAYGRSQDDLNLTPRSHYANPIMGLGVAGNWGAGGVHGAGYHGRGAHPGDFFASNGSGGSNGILRQDRSPRPLQHMHSRDDLDALRPRKTRRTGPSFDQDDPLADHDHSPSSSSAAVHGFLAMSPRPNGCGGGTEGGFMGERGGYLNTAGVYAGPDEVPPAPPRRLVSHHNTPSRPERSGAKNGGGGEGDEAGKRRGQRLMSLDGSAMDTDSSGGGGGGPGGGQGFQLAAHGFYAAMSPVVAPGRTGGFGGRRGHHRHSSSGTQQGSSGDLGAHGSQWRMGEVSPDEPAVLQGDSPSSSRSGGGSSTSGGGGGVLGAGLGLTAHAMSRMEKVSSKEGPCFLICRGHWGAVATTAPPPPPDRTAVVGTGH